MRTLLRLMLVIVLVLVAVWLVKNVSSGSGVHAQGAVQGAIEKVDRAVADLDLKSITEELKRTGRVIRRRAAQVARKIGDDSEDTRTTASIKAKLAADSQLSPLSIGVDSADGRVTLSGTVNSPADIARAIEIAFEQPSVTEVVSNLQVRSLREGAAPRAPSA